MKPIVKIVHCSRCGVVLGADQLRYVVGVHVTLDTDGLSEGDAEASRIARELSKAAAPDEALPDVLSREMAFTLCSCCRTVFVLDPLGSGSQRREPDRGYVQ